MEIKTYIINKKPSGIIARIRAKSPSQARDIFIKQNPEFDLSNIKIKKQKEK